MRPEDYVYSSYADYIGKRSAKWVKPEFIIGIMNNGSNVENAIIGAPQIYKDFVNDYSNDSEKFLGGLIIE